MSIDLEEYPKVRKLTRKDRKELTRILEKFASFESNKGLAALVPKTKSEKSEDTEADEGTQVVEIIAKVLEGILETLEDDVAAWFMDLTGVTSREEYDALPFDIEVNIVEQLKAQQGFSNFFSKAFGLYKKIKG